MKPYYEHGGATIYHGDAREVLPLLRAESIITDPVWPECERIFPGVDAFSLLASVLDGATSPRVIIHLGCDSDPRFLLSVPRRYKFFRVCSLEYTVCGYKGRLLNTGDMAYVFGTPPAAKPGAMVLPGKVVATSNNGYQNRSTGRTKHKSVQGVAYAELEHPAPRHIQHVRWLCKWFGGTSVVDPFMGIGTTALACKRLGIPFQGIEINESYCEIAAKRLSQEVLDFTEVGAEA